MIHRSLMRGPAEIVSLQKLLPVNRRILGRPVNCAHQPRADLLSYEAGRLTAARTTLKTERISRLA